MLNRRELIATSVALTLTAPGAGARSSNAAAVTSWREPGNEARPVAQFVAAANLAAARLEAEAAARQGATVVWIGSDLTPAYEQLDLAWRRAPVAVAGLTSTHDFFVLERLAWDRDLRTVRREVSVDPHGISVVAWRLEPRHGLREKGSDTIFSNIVPGT